MGEWWLEARVWFVFAALLFCFSDAFLPFRLPSFLRRFNASTLPSFDRRFDAFCSVVRRSFVRLYVRSFVRSFVRMLGSFFGLLPSFLPSFLSCLRSFFLPSFMFPRPFNHSLLSALLCQLWIAFVRYKSSGRQRRCAVVLARVGCWLVGGLVGCELAWLVGWLADRAVRVPCSGGVNG